MDGVYLVTKTYNITSLESNILDICMGKCELYVETASKPWVHFMSAPGNKGLYIEAVEKAIPLHLTIIRDPIKATRQFLEKGYYSDKNVIIERSSEGVLFTFL